MSVIDIKSYGNGVIKVILKSTKAFPEGSNFFYTDIQALPVVKRYTWYLAKKGKGVYVVANFPEGLKLFHREYRAYLDGVYPDYVDHVNGVGIDNTATNLNVVSQQQNMLNKPVRGYEIRDRKAYVAFRPQVIFKGELIRPCSTTHKEKEVCILQYQAEQKILRYKLGADFYQYNFLLDRRNDLDILDAERTGKISAEDATYRHVMRHASQNAWYYFRYNLEDYFKHYNIPVPNYKLDARGRLIHPITNELLCPYNK